MAERFRMANGVLAPVYNPSQIQAQAPATQSLYETLLQGLQGQADVGAQTVLESAARRGVDRASLLGEVQGTLGQDVALQGAQLGAQKAEDLAAIAGNLTGLGVGRAQASTDLAGTINTQDIQRQEALLQQQENQRKYEMDVQSLERDAEISKIEAQRRAAEARAAEARAVSRAGRRRGSRGQGDFDPEGIQSFLNQKRGKDGNVNPETYHQALDQWLEAGGSRASFHNKFRDYVNTSHAEDYYDIEKFIEKDYQKNLQARNNYRHGERNTVPLRGVSF